MSIKRIVPTVLYLTILFGLGLGLVMFERVNYITTYESLAALFGAHVWITILTWGVVLVDFFALSNVFLPTNINTPNILKALVGVWLTVSTLDVVFNWYFAALRMEQHRVAAPSAIADYLWVLPIVTALVIWGVQFGMLYLFGQVLEFVVHGNRRPAAVHQTQRPPVQRPQPVNVVR